jgi:hypothetical protein
MLKVISSAPTLALASIIACLSDPTPLSFTLSTMKVAVVAPKNHQIALCIAVKTHREHGDRLSINVERFADQ